MFSKKILGDGYAVKLAGTFQSDISIEFGGKKASAKKLFAVMGMGIKCGSAVTITAQGEEEAEAASQLEAFFRENL